jgi:assimilatory nitrate reductase catalytic subunit
MGFEQAFQYQDASDIFREHAALSGFENNAEEGLRDFDISALANMSQQEYDLLQPIQWPVNQAYPQGRARLFEDGQFFTASGKGQFIAIEPRSPVNLPDKHYPLILNTGRLRDQWHTMTRTALAAKLNQHKPEPFVEVHPADAQRHRLLHNVLTVIESQWGAMIARVQITDSQQQGCLFVPMHWTEQYASHGRMGTLVNPIVDPISKQPESKHTPVRIKPYVPAWQGFILSRQELAQITSDYWVKIKGDQFYRYELAGDTMPANWPEWAINNGFTADNWQAYQDPAKGNFRAAQFAGEQLQGVIFISAGGRLPEGNYLTRLFVNTQITSAERRALLSGCPPLGIADAGEIVCACFNVGLQTIKTAIKEQGLKTHQEVGLCLKAGTNCGSCLPEIKALLQ